MSKQREEKRGFIRIPFNTEVEVQSEGRSIRSREGINLSMSGIRLSTADATPAPGSPCQVLITLRASEQRVLIEAKGSVIRSAPGSLAAEFKELDLDSYNHLRQLILNNADEPQRAEKEFTTHWGIRPLR